MDCLRLLGYEVITTLAGARRFKMHQIRNSKISEYNAKILISHQFTMDKAASTCGGRCRFRTRMVLNNFPYSLPRFDLGVLVLGKVAVHS